MKRLISFSMLKKNCVNCDGGNGCFHDNRKPLLPFEYGRCSAKTCPIWKRLKRGVA